MSDIEARVRKIIAEQLGVAEAEVTNEMPSLPTSGPTRSTLSNW